MPYALILSAALTLAPTTADDEDSARGELRQVLALLAERPMSEELVRAYAELHGRAWLLRETETARVAVERIVDFREEQLRDDPVRLAAHLTALGTALYDRRDFVGVRPLYERALTLNETALGDEHDAVADGQNKLASICWQLGDLAESRRRYERAVAIYEALHGPDAPVLALVLTNLSVVLSQLGDHEAARSVCQRALVIREATLGPDHLDVADTLNNLGVLLRTAGDLSGALSAWERSLSIREAVLGPEHPLVADSVGNVANAHSRMGNLVEARALQERAFAIREATLDPDDPRLALGLHNLGVITAELGDLAEARRLYDRALAIRETVYGDVHLLVAESLASLSALHRKAGRPAEARRLGERELAIRQAILGPEHPKVADTLSGMANMLMDGGDAVGARALYERVLAIREANQPPGHPRIGSSAMNLAAALRRTGELTEAGRLYERALDILESAFGPEHREVSLCLERLALLSLDAGDAAAAARWTARLADRRARLRQTLASLTEGEAHLHLARQSGRLFTEVAVALAAGDDSGAYAAVLEAKGQVSRLTLQTRAQIRESLDAETLALTEEVASVQARLSRLALDADVDDPEQHGAKLEALRSERDALERRLRSRVEVEETSAATLEQIRAALPEGAALVDLLVHWGYVPARFEDEVLREPGDWSEVRLSAWIVRRDAAGARHVDLGPLADIEAALDAHLRTVTAEGGERGVVVADARAPSAEPSADLRASLWEPLEASLDGCSTVFLSPDSGIGRLPFETLRDEAGRYLIEDVALVYLPDGGALVSMREGEPSLGSSLLAAGGVDYDRAGPMPAGVAVATSPGEAMSTVGELARGGAGGWAALPATRDEARAVAAAHRTLAGDDGSQLVLEGVAATEERLEAEMPRHGILHLATHGFFRSAGLPAVQDGESDDASGDHGHADDAAARVARLHPGLLSGLVLAGANQRPKDATDDPSGWLRDDGYLTASEVTLLDLSNVDLVVLSACETGLGRAQAGEGLLGLRRAFHMAGADTVISSLWAVGDESTSRLMQSFYANLFVEGMGRQQALRAAQLEMLRANREENGDGRPGTWGAFVLSGEWR